MEYVKYGKLGDHSVLVHINIGNLILIWTHKKVQLYLFKPKNLNSKKTTKGPERENHEKRRPIITN